MRFGLSSSLSAVLLACSIYCEAVQTEPVNLHAANAAEAADVAEQAATVAKRVAAHTEEVAHDTAQALRYTRDALKRAHADANDVAEVGRQADKLDEEAGITSSAGGASGHAHGESEESSVGDSNRDMNRDIERISNDINRDIKRDGLSNGGSDGGSAGSASGSADSASGSSDQSGGRGGRSGSGGRGGHGDGLHGGPGGEGGFPGPGRSLDIDNAISPYPNGVEPFGQEAPAKELTKESVKQSDGMIDQIENTQGVESKRAVYRALTKLRGATIASYDGMAKSHLANVDSYNKKHSWREEHPMKHLAEEEADTEVWAFPKKSPSGTKAAPKKAPAGNKPAAAPAAAQ